MNPISLNQALSRRNKLWGRVKCQTKINSLISSIDISATSLSKTNQQYKTVRKSEHYSETDKGSRQVSLNNCPLLTPSNAVYIINRLRIHNSALRRWVPHSDLSTISRSSYPRVSPRDFINKTMQARFSFKQGDF